MILPPSDSSRTPTAVPELSVVIPAYNEADRILPYLISITNYLGQQGRSYEVVVVDDGSQDGTGEVVETFRRKERAVRLLPLGRNLGKGGAVRTGMRHARGRLRLIADADGATPIQELERLETHIQDGADIAIGSRFLASRDRRFRVDARWHRTVLGNLFNRLVQQLGIPGITDTQCGFKLFREAAAQDLFSISRINGYGYDLELLFLARHRGYRVDEVPVNWADQPGSKVHVVRDGLCMLCELFLIRHHHASGRYALPESTKHEARGSAL